MPVSTPLLTISSTPPSLSSNHHGMALIVCEGGCGLKGNKICRFLLHCLTGTRPHTQASSEGEAVEKIREEEEEDSGPLINNQWRESIGGCSLEFGGGVKMTWNFIVTCKV